MAPKREPLYPIIYVRGYAMTAAEIDSAAADPFCGFNIGSTVLRAVPDKTQPPRRFMFESPVLRLASDFGYQDVYEDGYDILDQEWTADPENRLSNQSIIVFRYYDESARLLGNSKKPSIPQFAQDLGALIVKVRDLVCANPANKTEPNDFRCYLVAHSMGGLVCRAFLQNADNDPQDARRYVDKFFTYASPHNGIELAGLNVPSWVALHGIDTFNRETIAKYLNLEQALKKTERVDWLPEERFPSSRVFCMVGTNRLDYETAAGVARTFVGHGSDGLVRIENATLMGLRADNTPGSCCAKAFAYRSHSGYFGIVNSEEGYQNLTRFLFGDVRVDVWLDVDGFKLPPKLQERVDGGEQVDALYQFELLASPRGKLWYLTRRTAEEDSVACLRHLAWTQDKQGHRSHYLSSVFLANRARVNKKRRSLAYSVTLGVRVPDYEVDRKLWVDEHFEGGYLFRDAVVVEITPPTVDTTWKIQCAWQGVGINLDRQTVTPNQVTSNGATGGVELSLDLPTGQSPAPSISGTLRFVVSGWNQDVV